MVNQSIKKQLKIKHSPFRKTLAIYLMEWRKHKSVKNISEKFKIDKRRMTDYLRCSNVYKNRKTKRYGSRLKRKRQQKQQICIKNSNYRKHASFYLKMWKKYRSIEKVSQMSNTPKYIIKELLMNSKIYSHKKEINLTDREYITKWSLKKWAINALNCQCVQCGNQDIFVLEFHHSDGNKETGISNLIRKGGGCGNDLKSLKSEVKKCQLLCRNCHQGLHHPNPKNKQHKKRLMEINGSNKCTTCGYNENTACIEFHHPNPEDKKFEIGTISDPRRTLKKLNDYKIEIKKCKILCSNCHQKFHINKEKFKKFKLLIEIKSRLIGCGYHIKLMR